MKTDVLVAGGGSAGLAAAIAAARCGARVVLVERQSMLGGMATSAHVHSICGLYQLRATETEPLLDSNSGFPREFAQRLIREGGARGPVRMGRLDVVLHRPSSFAHLADRYVDGKIGILTLSSRGIRSDWEPSAVIDTTGDAEIAQFSGAACEQTPLHKLQRPAYIFALGGVDPDSMSDNGRMAIARAISYAVSGGQIPKAALGIAFRAGVTPQEVWGTIDLAAEGLDPSDSQSLSQMEMHGREIAVAVTDFLKNELVGFRSAFISAFPARAGIREGYRVKGLEELTEQDILTGARYPDEVALSSWPIELRETALGPKFRFPEANRSCGIRLGCLRSQNVKNLFMAGRCISTTHEAQAAVRVIGTCMATGEAAGKAAADWVSSGHQIDPAMEGSN
ncbi:MAG: FAD-dependent oxidoreductase [Verrucomicrobia bacterium]|nr:FAD-dependent oxidoreductase [Verrucomicrobiota bacterium]